MDLTRERSDDLGSGPFGARSGRPGAQDAGGRSTDVDTPSTE